MKVITRTIWILSLVSMFADIASEMLYPVIPVYLKEIGFSVFLIGLLEGIASFTAGLSKGYFGKKSDEKGKRLPFIRIGYFLSALSKPLMAAFTNPLWVFFARTTDRLGKGFRTAARDALLSDNATPATKARVFGFHRSMDTLGAAIGPCIALLFLVVYPQQYQLLFLIAFIPGLLSVFLLFFLKEKPIAPVHKKHRSFFSYFSYWKEASPAFKKLVPGLLLFALFNSADVFLLLKTKEVTGSDSFTIGLYILYNLVFAVAAYPVGIIADHLGIRKIFLTGLLVFAAVYAMFSYASSFAVLATAFVFYGLYAAATEGIAKAWITNVTSSQTATALGFYASCESIAALIASALTGFVWSYFGSMYALFLPVIAAVIVFFYLLFNTRK